MDTNDLRNTLFQISQGSPPDPLFIDKFDVGTESYIRFFEESVLNSLIFRGHSTCRVYDGPYGSGKSHILNLLQLLAINKNMIFAKITIGGNYHDFDDWQYVVREILQELTYYNNKRVIKGLPKILESVSGNIQHIKPDNLPHKGVVNAITKFVKEFERLNNEQNEQRKQREQRELLSMFLEGKRVRIGELRQSGIRGVKNPLSKRNAEYFLNTTLSMLYNLGYPVMLLIDENEQYLGRPDNMRNRMSANIIRRIIDSCSNGSIKGTVIVFTVVRGFIENIGRAYQAVGERLSPPNIQNRYLTWRWPVLEIEDLTTLRDREEFLQGCIDKYISTITIAKPEINERKVGELLQKLQKVGRSVITQNPGISFRRELARKFASTIYEYLFKEEGNGNN